MALDVACRIRAAELSRRPWPLSGGSGVPEGRWRTERLFQERDADALRAAHSFKVAGVHGLPFIISANRARRTRDDFAFLGQARTRLVRETLSGPCWHRRIFGQDSEGRPNAASTFLSMTEIEEVDQGGVLPFDKPDFQSPHEAADRQPKIIPHHDHALHSFPVALPQRLNQFGVLFVLTSHAAIARTDRQQGPLFAASVPPGEDV